MPSFQVKDTGEGMAAEELSHIWEHFYQTEDAHTHVNGGAGLEGSCFRVHLPSVMVEGESNRFP
jgi:signal transduction histidine kinase